MQQLFSKLCLIPNGQLRRGEPLSLHTAFRTGGCADLFVAETEQALVQAVLLLRESGAKFFLLGRGSNLLALDEGYDGIVLHCTASDIAVSGNLLTASCGASLADVCRAAAEHSLSGLEFAYGIPGSVGGAVYMNAGAYGGEVKQVLHSVRVLCEDGEIRSMPAQQLELSYRNSIFHRNRRLVILSAEFQLQEGDREAIFAKMNELMAARLEKQPLDLPSCGSTFKRPQGAFAAKLIEESGLRGFSVGGAQVSEKHCGFVVNRGGATSCDILRLIAEVQRIVAEKTGYNLEPEVEILR